VGKSRKKSEGEGKNKYSRPWPPEETPSPGNSSRAYLECKWMKVPYEKMPIDPTRKYHVDAFEKNLSESDTTQQNNNAPAFPSTTCPSIERLILDEHTTPNDSFDSLRFDDGGGNPGGVDGRGKRAR